MVPMMVVAHGFLSGAPHTAVVTRAPGRATRASSRAAPATSGKNMNPNRAMTASKLPSANGSAPASHCCVFTL